MPRPGFVVFDTSVLISLILEASFSQVIFRKLKSEGGKVVLTPQIYAELKAALDKPRVRKWLRVSDADVEWFVARLPAACHFVRRVPQVHGAVKADPDDDKILAAAWASHASHVVTEDRHLLDLAVWRGIPIVTRRQFRDILHRADAA